MHACSMCTRGGLDLTHRPRTKPSGPSWLPILRGIFQLSWDTAANLRETQQLTFVGHSSHSRRRNRARVGTAGIVCTENETNKEVRRPGEHN